MLLTDFVDQVKTLGEMEMQDGAKYSLSFDLSYTKYSGEKLDVSGILAKAKLSDTFELAGGRVASVLGEVFQSRTLRLIDPWITRIKGAEVKFHCLGFTLGHEYECPFESGYYNIYIRLPNNPLLESPRTLSFSALGTIEYVGSSRRDWDQGITWQTYLGKFIAADFYCFESEGLGSELTTRVKLAEIRLKGDIDKTLVPPKVIEEVEQQIRDPLALLSFLSRRFLLWYEICLKLRAPRGSGLLPQEFIKHRRITRFARMGKEPLLNYGHLQEGRFQPLIERLRSSPIRDWLDRAMIYTISSYHEPTIETQITMAYLAIEVLTEGYARHSRKLSLLPDEKEAELVGKIREAIEAFCESELTGETELRQQLLAKTQGFGSSSLKRRILELIKGTGIKVDDLWPTGTSLSNGLQGVIRRRNDFVHRAKIENALEMAKDLDRLQTMAERSILELLGWNSTEVHPPAFERNRWLKRDD